MRRAILCSTVLLALLSAAAPARAATARAPGGDIVVTLDEAPAALSATLDGEAVLAPQPLGLRWAQTPTAPTATVVSVLRRRVDESVDTITGPRRHRRLRATELLAELEDATGHRFRVRVRVTDRGAAYRYELPGGPATLFGEAGGFAPVGVTASWTAPHTPNGEALWGGPSERTVFARPGELLTPALLRLDGRDRFALLAEAGVGADDVASRLAQDGATYRYVLPRRGDTTTFGPMESGDTVPLPVAAGWRGPWRVAILGRLADVATATLIADLSEPARGRFAWVSPGTAAWSWLTDHASPRSLEQQLREVRFAGAHGWRYVNVDEGWPALGDGLRTLAQEARSRRVRLIFWFNRRSLADPAQRARELDRVAALGAAGVKVDFFDDETQPTMQLARDIAADAARRHLVVDLHGFTVPRGLERTWPNILSFEGVRGAEYYDLARQYAGLVPAPTPEHETILAFTRAVAGPTDATPVTFTVPGRVTSDAFELALPIVWPTGLLHPADSVAAYEARPQATAVLDRMPVTWDASLLLDGFPGRRATFARRHGATWWLGSITAGPASRLDVPLDFLKARNGRYRATITQDAPGPDVASVRRVVTAADRLDLPVEADGGVVARFVPLDCAASRRHLSSRRPKVCR